MWINKSNILMWGIGIDKEICMLILFNFVWKIINIMNIVFIIYFRERFMDSFFVFNFSFLVDDFIFLS